MDKHQEVRLSIVKFKDALADEIWFQDSAKKRAYAAIGQMIRAYWSVDNIYELNDEQLALLTDGLKRHKFKLYGGHSVKHLQNRFKKRSNK